MGQRSTKEGLRVEHRPCVASHNAQSPGATSGYGTTVEWREIRAGRGPRSSSRQIRGRPRHAGVACPNVVDWSFVAEPAEHVRQMRTCAGLGGPASSKFASDELGADAAASPHCCEARETRPEAVRSEVEQQLKGNDSFPDEHLRKPNSSGVHLHEPFRSEAEEQ